MAVNGIEIAVGQRWRTRGGEEVRITRFDAKDDQWPWRITFDDGRDDWVNNSGEYDGSLEVDLDLIEPIYAVDERPAPDIQALPVVDAMPQVESYTLPGGQKNFVIAGDATNVDARIQAGLSINPKDAIGATKIPVHLWPAEATALGCLGMLEGMLKYGQNNFIAGDGVIASIYVDAAMRHLMAWFAGEECAHDTGTPHLANALATIAIVVKARAHRKLIDDRDYSPLPNAALYRQFIEEITPHVGRLKEMFKDKSPQHFTIADIRAGA